MTIIRAITNDMDEDLNGKKVAIRDKKIDCCPGCAAIEAPITENKEFGLMFVGHHPVPGTSSYCKFSGVPLKTLPENSLKEERITQ